MMISSIKNGCPTELDNHFKTWFELLVPANFPHCQLQGCFYPTRVAANLIHLAFHP